MIVKSQAAPEVERVYHRARELAERVGDRARGFAALMGLARFAISAGRLDAAREVAEQALALATQLDDPLLRWQSHLTLGSTAFYVGQPSRPGRISSRGSRSTNRTSLDFIPSSPGAIRRSWGSRSSPTRCGSSATRIRRSRETSRRWR